jgi:hypothetical protein
MNPGIETKDLGTLRLLTAFTTLAVVLLLLLAWVPFQSYRTEWRSVQERYNAP